MKQLNCGNVVPSTIASRQRQAARRKQRTLSTASAGGEDMNRSKADLAPRVDRREVGFESLRRLESGVRLLRLSGGVAARAKREKSQSCRRWGGFGWGQAAPTFRHR